MSGILHFFLASLLLPAAFLGPGGGRAQGSCDLDHSPTDDDYCKQGRLACINVLPTSAQLTDAASVPCLEIGGNDNPITDADLENILKEMGPLNRISVQHGMLTKVPNFLNKSSDSLKSLSITQMRNLDEIDLQNLAKFTTIQQLDFLKCGIRTIHPMAENQTFQYLQSLDLRQNEIEQIPPVLMRRGIRLRIMLTENAGMQCDSCMLWMTNCEVYDVEGTCRSFAQERGDIDIKAVNATLHIRPELMDIDCTYRGIFTCHPLLADEEKGDQLFHRHGAKDSKTRHLNIRCAAACAAKETCKSFDVVDSKCALLDHVGGNYEKV